MNTNLIHKIAFSTTGSIRLTTVTLLLLCLLAIGSSVVSSDLEGDVTLLSSVELTQISGLPGIPVNGMTDDGNRPAEGILCLNAISLLHTDNSGKRQKKNLKDGLSFESDGYDQDSGFAVCSAISLVNSRLGNQFTLVGAKPSGTS